MIADDAFYVNAVVISVYVKCWLLYSASHLLSVYSIYWNMFSAESGNDAAAVSSGCVGVGGLAFLCQQKVYKIQNRPEWASIGPNNKISAHPLAAA